MKSRLLTLSVLLTVFTSVLFAQFESAPAFPGAEGHGRFVTGGRGGKIVHVTNLNDSGTGSLRAAVSGNEKKIVVFDVAGVIALRSNLSFGDNTTILGQTAPAPGITLRYYTVSPGSNNIIRFMRFRRGQERDVNEGADAFGQRHKTGIIIDHCSMSWSIDEVASFYDNNNFTMQWSTITESLTNAGHGKGAHGYGGIWGGKLASFHHNMIAHVSNRGPRFNGARYAWTGYTSNKNYKDYNWANPVQAENVDFRNCLMYNAQGTCYGGPGGGQVNMVNNYYKAGPANNKNMNIVTNVSLASSGNAEGSDAAYMGMASRYYIAGNTTETNTGMKTVNQDWKGVKYDGGTTTFDGFKYFKDPASMYAEDAEDTIVNGARYVRIKMDTPAPTGYITTHTAAKAKEKLLSYVGASLHYDDVDSRNISEATESTAFYIGSVTGTPGLIDLVSDVEGYTETTFGTGSHPSGYDSDKDGMPDEWEIAWGLDPNNAADARLYTMDEKKYYTNLEVYANSLVEDIMKGGNEEGEANFTEYWPELKVIEKTETSGVDASLYLAQSTNTGSNSTASYAFKTGDYHVTITNQKAKKYGTGKEDGVKYSAGVQYTINLPANFTATEVVIYGYDNYDVEAYLAELNGETFSATDYTWKAKDASGTYTIVEHKIPVNATGTLTFTPGAKQCVWCITVNGTVNTAIYNTKAETVKRDNVRRNLAGQIVSNDYKGIVILNGKKFLNK